MRSSDALVLPQVVGLEVHGLWVSSSESLGNPCVMELLSITELEEASASTDESSEDESAEALVQVNIEVVWSSFLASHEIGEGEPSSEESESSGLHSSDELEVVVEIEEVQVEQLWVVLDKFDWSNFFRQGGVFLLGVSGVSVN